MDMTILHQNHNINKTDHASCSDSKSLLIKLSNFMIGFALSNYPHFYSTSLMANEDIIISTFRHTLFKKGNNEDIGICTTKVFFFFRLEQSLDLGGFSSD